MSNRQGGDTWKEWGWCCVSACCTPDSPTNSRVNSQQEHLVCNLGGGVRQGALVTKSIYQFVEVRDCHGSVATASI